MSKENLDFDLERDNKLKEFDLNICEIEKILGYTFKNKNLLRQAFIHYSFQDYYHTLGNVSLIKIGEAKILNASLDYMLNKRLKLLDDKDYKGAVVSECQYFNRFDEVLKDAVSLPIILEVFEGLDLGKYMLYHEFEDENLNDNPIRAQANCFLAILGAIYVDSKNENLLKDLIKKCFLDKGSLRTNLKKIYRYNGYHNRDSIKVNSVILGDYYRAIIEFKIDRRYHSFQGIGKTNTIAIDMAADNACKYLYKVKGFQDLTLEKKLLYKLETPISCVNSLFLNYGDISNPHFVYNDLKCHECRFIYNKTGDIIVGMGETKNKAALNALDRLLEVERNFELEHKNKKDHH